MEPSGRSRTSATEPAANSARLATASWSAQPDAPPERGETRPGASGGDPAEMARRVGRSPAEARLREAPFEALATAPAPFLAMLREGGCVAIVEDADGREMIDGAGRRAKAPNRWLAARYSGAVLAFDPQTDRRKAPRAPEPHSAGAGSDRSATARVGDESPASIEEPSTHAWPASSGASLAATTIARLFGPRLGLTAQLMGAAIASNIFAFALPLFTMTVYDRVIPHGANTTLLALTVGVGVVIVLDLLLKMVRARLVEAIALRTSAELSEAAFGRITRTKLASANRSIGSATMASQSAEAMCHAAPAALVGAAVDIPFALLALAYVAYIGGPVAYAPLAALALIVAATLIGHVVSRRAAAESTGLGAEKFAFLGQVVGALDLVKLRTAGRQFERIWRRMLDAASFEGHRARLASTQAGAVSTAIVQAATVGVLAIGAFQVQAGAMSMGALVACSILINRVLTPVAQAVGAWARLAQSAAGARALEAALAADLDDGADVDAAPRGRLSGDVRFTDARFSYPETATPALDGASFAIGSRERVAIVGRSGSGKSTVARLLTRLYEPEHGTVLLDGHDVRHYAPDALRSAVAVLTQEAELFDDTLRENLLVGLREPDPARFRRVVEATGVAALAARSADGFGMRVGPGGRRLSGGERQVVALARTLLADSPIVVLDEPTAALDARMEAQIVQALAELLDGRTVILVTHRAPALALVDRVIWLEDGRVAADGPRDEVFARLTKRGDAR